MRRLTQTLCSVAGAAALIGSSCPNQTRPLPPPLGAPRIVSIDMTAMLTGSGPACRYREAIRIRWVGPNQDSNKVLSYSVLRRASVSGDTGFSVVTHSIPGSVTVSEHSIDDIDPPPIGAVKYIVYRIAAVDTLNVPGDTSAPDTFVYIHPAHLRAPTDTLTVNLFEWGVVGMPLGFFSYLMLWNQSGLVWQSPRPQTPTYGGENPEIPVNVSLPDSLWPLPPGMYYYGVKVEAAMPGKPSQAVVVSEPLYVP